MKVYIVTGGEYSNYHIEAVFLTKKKAELYIPAHEVWDGRIETYETNDDNIHGDILAIKYKYFITFRHSPKKGWEDITLGRGREYSVATLDREGVKVSFSDLIWELVDANIEVVLKNKNAWNKATKIAQDALYEEWAKREGIA